MTEEHKTGGSFATTLWTEVLRAVDPHSSQRRESLERLIVVYWRPLYSLARRRSRSPEESRDLVQEFFTRLLEKDWLSSADPDRGRFRTYLRTAFTRFLSNERDRSGAGKRGGDRLILSLDFEGEESGLRLDPADPRTPEQHFDREWARTVLRRALDQLKEECDAQDRGVQYELLHTALGGDPAGNEELAARHKLQLHDVKNYLHRARTRLRTLMLQEIGALVEDGSQVEGELQDLWRALG